MINLLFVFSLVGIIHAAEFKVPRGFGVSPDQIETALKRAHPSLQEKLRAAVNTAVVLDQAPTSLYEVLGGISNHTDSSAVAQIYSSRQLEDLTEALLVRFPTLEPDLLLATLGDIWFAAEASGFNLKAHLLDNWSSQTVANNVMMVEAIIPGAILPMAKKETLAHHENTNMDDLADYLLKKRMTLQQILKHSKKARAIFEYNFKELAFAEMWSPDEIPFYESVAENYVKGNAPLRFHQAADKSRQQQFLNRFEKGPPGTRTLNVTRVRAEIFYSMYYDIYHSMSKAESERPSVIMRKTLDYLRADELNGDELRSFFLACLVPFSHGDPRIRPEEYKAAVIEEWRRVLRSMAITSEQKGPPKLSLDWMESLNLSFPRGSSLLSESDPAATPLPGDLTPFVQENTDIKELKPDFPYTLNFEGCHALFGVQTQTILNSAVVKQLQTATDIRGARRLEWLKLIEDGHFEPAGEKVYEGRIKRSRWRLRAGWDENGFWRVEAFAPPAR